MPKVRAVFNGREGQRSITGWIICDIVPFVSLPSKAALYRQVRVTNPLTNLSIQATVLDVGPHFENDEPYVFGASRPEVEFRTSDDYGRTIHENGGIGLGLKVWRSIGMHVNGEVEWEFI